MPATLNLSHQSGHNFIVWSDPSSLDLDPPSFSSHSFISINPDFNLETIYRRLRPTHRRNTLLRSFNNYLQRHPFRYSLCRRYLRHGWPLDDTHSAAWIDFSRLLTTSPRLRTSCLALYLSYDSPFLLIPSSIPLASIVVPSSP